MRHAVPGEDVWRAFRRDEIRDPRVLTCAGRRDPYIYPSDSSMRYASHCIGSRTFFWCNFTLQLSGFGVGQGRLGEVVSLVGDCRPPPPGNPRRPAGVNHATCQRERPRVSRSLVSSGGLCFTPTYGECGDILSSEGHPSSLNIVHIVFYLKKLTNHQYFKINRSYYSCSQKKRVLEFERVHSHLCGLRVVKPPPIAITNVLVTE
jgi:hypothetical protein